MSDLLNMAFINSLPQPLYMQEWGDSGDDWLWPVTLICVETGFMQIDVCGIPQSKHISDVKRFKDEAGNWHPVDDFYLEDVQPVPAREE